MLFVNILASKLALGFGNITFYCHFSATTIFNKSHDRLMRTEKGSPTWKNHMGNFQKSQRTLKLAASHKLSCLNYLFFSFLCFFLGFLQFPPMAFWQVPPNSIVGNNNIHRHHLLHQPFSIELDCNPPKKKKKNMISL